ncbi:hypothetical protein DDN39_18430, partial [Vibrio cholerae]|nr:hypothetical protein [Vibrio cholerae]
ELSEISGYFDNHLWLENNLLSEVSTALQTSLKEGEKILKRVASLESGFQNLPLEKSPTLALNSDNSDAIEGELCD